MTYALKLRIDALEARVQALEKKGETVNDHLKTVPCRSCGEYIVFLPTKSGKQMPVDAESVTEGDSEFDASTHVSHFSTCPDAGKFRKRDQ